MMETAGRYQIQDMIGRGGMATVYRATDPATRREVAVKVLSGQTPADEVSQRRFQIEAQTIAALEHEAIVPLYDFGESDGRLYMVMRLMSGGSLANRLEDGPLPLPQAIGLIQRLAPALDAAHAKGIVHRDLKPANILFDGEGKPYLCDFGIAKLMEGSGTLTGGSLVGTPAYMSPEQITDAADIGPYSDIYSLGVILYEMLTGRRPYEASAFVVAAMEFEKLPIAGVREISPALPEGCDRVIARAMGQYPAERYTTVGEMAAELAAVGQPAGKKEEKRLPGAAFQLKSRPALMWGLISLLIVSTAALGLLLSSLANPKGPVATQITGQASLLATSEAVLPFDEDAFGLLLLLEAGPGEAGRLAANLNGDLRAALVSSGLANQVESDVRPLAGLALEEEAARQGARLAMLIQASEEAGGLAVSARAFLNEAIQPAGFSQYVPAMQATIDALLAPFAAPSAAEASQVLAGRLAAIANTAAGVIALHDGAYSDCTRRFTAVLALLEQIDLAYKRAEASHASLALCLDALGQHEEARDHYQAAVAINPDYSLAYYGLGNYYYNLDDYPRARGLYEETISRSFSDPLSSDEIVSRAYIGLGNLAQIDGDYPAAVAALDQAAGLMPGFPAIYLARALAQRALGREAEAQADLTRCLETAVQAEPRQSDYFRQVEAECRALLVEMAATATPTPTMAATATPVPEQQQDREKPVVQVTAASAALRRGPGTAYPALVYLLAGERVAVIARNEAGDWYNVESGGGLSGWIAASVVETVEGDPPAVAPAETIPALPHPSATATTTPTSSPTPGAAGSTSKPPTVPPPAPTQPPPPPQPPTSPPPQPTPEPP